MITDNNQKEKKARGIVHLEGSPFDLGDEVYLGREKFYITGLEIPYHEDSPPGGRPCHLEEIFFHLERVTFEEVDATAAQLSKEPQGPCCDAYAANIKKIDGEPIKFCPWCGHWLEMQAEDPDTKDSTGNL
jgi:hypothetical protein